MQMAVKIGGPYKKNTQQLCSERILVFILYTLPHATVCLPDCLSIVILVLEMLTPLTIMLPFNLL